MVGFPTTRPGRIGGGWIGGHGPDVGARDHSVTCQNLYMSYVKQFGLYREFGCWRQPLPSPFFSDGNKSG